MTIFNVGSSSGIGFSETAPSAFQRRWDRAKQAAEIAQNNYAENGGFGYGQIAALLKLSPHLSDRELIDAALTEYDFLLEKVRAGDYTL